MYPLIHLAKGLEIPSFFLVISLVLSISLFWVAQRAQIYKLPQKRILDLSLLLMAAALVGARLFHVFYENPEYYAPTPWKVFYLWEGGFVYFGGAFLATLAAVLYFRFFRIKNPGAYFDTFAPVLAFSYGAGRIGCFLAGCCYGRMCDYPWAVEGRHPTQLYATLWEFAVVMILLGFEKAEPRKRVFFLKQSGSLFVFWIALHAIGRIMMESFRDDFRGNEIFGLSISMAISLALLLISLTMLGRISVKKS